MSGGARGAKVLKFCRHEPTMTITKWSGLKPGLLICPCKLCGKTVEFPVEEPAA